MDDQLIALLVEDLHKTGTAWVAGDDATKATARRVKDMARAEGLRVHYATGVNDAGNRWLTLETT